MKKYFFSLVILITFTSLGFAQSGLNIGGHVGLPIGDAEDYSTLNFGGDLSYLFEINETVFFGISAGYTSWAAEEQDLNPEITFIDKNYLPIAATGLFQINDRFNVGGDIGYGMALENAYEGGLYYQPKVGVSFNKVRLSFGFKGITGITDDVDAATAGVTIGL